MPPDSEGRKTSSGRKRKKGNPAKVWSECGVTMPINDTTAHIRFSFGFEKIAPDDSENAIKRVEKEIFELSEEVVQRRVVRLKRMIARIDKE